MRSFIVAGIAVLIGGSLHRPVAHAAPAFIDNFENGSLVDDDPVSWRSVGGELAAVEGAMQLTPDSAEVMVALTDWPHTDARVEMIVEYSTAEGQVAPAALRKSGLGSGGLYFAGVTRIGELEIGYVLVDGTIAVTGEGVFLPTGALDPGDEVSVVAQIVGSTITLEGWKTDAGRESNAMLSWT
ncbi:MAG: hypothetical protein AAF961_08285, partial [Planctomycetota bacterium]